MQLIQKMAQNQFFLNTEPLDFDEPIFNIRPARYSDTLEIVCSVPLAKNRDLTQYSQNIIRQMQLKSCNRVVNYVRIQVTKESNMQKEQNNLSGLLIDYYLRNQRFVTTFKSCFLEFPYFSSIFSPNSRWKFLIMLDIYEADMGPKEVAIVTSCQFKYLKQIDLSSNPIGNQGVKSLSKADWPSLEFIGIRNTHITTDVFCYLKRIKRMSKMIIYLSFVSLPTSKIRNFASLSFRMIRIYVQYPRINYHAPFIDPNVAIKDQSFFSKISAIEGKVIYLNNFLIPLISNSIRDGSFCLNRSFF